MLGGGGGGGEREMRNTKFWSKNLKGRDHLEVLGIHGVAMKFLE
jgi:hypothetical protein